MQDGTNVIIFPWPECNHCLKSYFCCQSSVSPCLFKTMSGICHLKIVFVTTVLWLLSRSDKFCNQHGQPWLIGTARCLTTQSPIVYGHLETLVILRTQTTILKYHEYPLGLSLMGVSHWLGCETSLLQSSLYSNHVKRYGLRRFTGLSHMHSEFHLTLLVQN